MIHTLMLTSQITMVTFQKLVDHPSSKYIPDFQKHFNYSLSEEGFKEISYYKIGSDGYYSAYVDIQLNPMRLFDKENRHRLLDLDSVSIIANYFDQHIRAFNEDLPSFFFWKIRRVDYSINIKTHLVEEYITLFQRGNKPHCMTIPRNQRTHDRSHKNGSMYLISKSSNINFYNKHDQAVKESFKHYKSSDEDYDTYIEQAKDILRLEVQCLKNKTNYLRTKYALETKYLYEFIKPQISYEIILKAYLDTACAGHYYKLKDAIRVINETKYNSSHKNDLIAILKLVNEKRSVWKAKDEYTGRRAFTKCLYDLNRELHINPVTIPSRWELDFIPSLVDEIQHQFEGQVNV